MKISLVMTDGLRQIALTPEDAEEKQLLEFLHSADWELEVKRGQFYICRGGYARFGATGDNADNSAVLVLRPRHKAHVIDGTIPHESAP